MRRRCSACLLPIVSGDTYIDSAFVGDDGPYSWVAHDVCDRAVIDHRVSDPTGHGFDEGYLQDWRNWFLDPEKELTLEWREWYAERSGKRMEVA